MRRRGVLLAALALAACTVTPWVDDESASRPPEVELSAVPFYPQQEYQCGPAALATVLGASGIDRHPDELAPSVYLPGRQGSLQSEMLAASRRQGVLPYVLAPRVGAILDEVVAGNPVLVLQRLGLGPIASWHYAVVVGYDLAKQEVILRSGGKPRRRMDISAFAKSWEQGGRWAFVTLVDGGLPATATEDRFVEAAVALERVDPAAAERFYASALNRWPRNLPARMGQGNVAWQRRDLPTALAAFRRATQDHPESADAWNNLALALHQSGARRDAIAAARRAVETGGPRSAIYGSTLSEVMAGSQ